MTSSASVRSQRTLFPVASLMFSISRNYGRSSGQDKPIDGATWSTENLRSASRCPKDRTTNPTAQMTRSLREVRNRTPCWTSGIMCLHAMRMTISTMTVRPAIGISSTTATTIITIPTECCGVATKSYILAWLAGCISCTRLELDKRTSLV
jgi:hypothetical protein